MDDREVLLLLTIAMLTIYVVGVGGTTATAIRIRESWRHRTMEDGALMPRDGGEVVLSAPTLPRMLARLRLVGWAAFLPALVLAVFANRGFIWVSPVVVGVMVALNAFYFTAMQNMGEQLTLNREGFRLGAGGKAGGKTTGGETKGGKTRTVRWVHVTEFTGARVGAFSGTKMSEAGEWQDPKLKPNVIFFRLNRALTRSRRSLVHRLIGFSYYDGVIRNAFGVPTDQLLRAMREWQRQALEAEELPLGTRAPST